MTQNLIKGYNLCDFIGILSDQIVANVAGPSPDSMAGRNFPYQG